MSKKLSFLALIFIFLFPAGSVVEAAADYWNNNTGDRKWSTPGNWSLGRIPDAAYIDDAIIQKTGAVSPIFADSDGSKSAWFIPVGQNGVNGELEIQGGTLTAPWGMAFNKNSGSSSNSTVHMSNGLLYLKGSLNESLEIGRAGYATFYITKGSVICTGLYIPSGSGHGVLNLDGGSVSANSVTLAGPTGSVTGVINITKGQLILTGDKVSDVNGYISSGAIIPYPGQTGRKIVNVDYDSYTPGKTTVTASRTEPNQAWNPVPMDTHPNVEKSATLQWSPGNGAVYHDLYLGVDFDEVNNGTEPLITTDANSYIPNSLVCGQTYYWRVDESNETNTYKGAVWSFTVAYNPLASEPSPVNGATNIDPNANLTWMPGDTATAHDVYFGTSFAAVNSATDPNTLPGRGRQTATSYEPGTLVLGQKYYWRIDEFDGTDVQKGDIWSFEVAQGIASQPQPMDGKHFVDKDVVLRWSAGYGAISHDVYIGTNSSDVNDGVTPAATIGETSYDPGGLQLGQTYYWRIDEFDGANKYKGTVWSFATEPIGSIRAFPGAEGYGAYSTGGRGGDVYHVTNLTDDATDPQPGSLRYGICSATGPRTIVFDVSGYIDLQDRLEITKSHLTVAGQTAPGLGVTTRKNDVRIYDTNNLIVRYLRMRPGYYTSGQNITPHGYLDLDGLSIEGGQNIILDHISTSWSRDECMSVGGDSNDVTVQWCTLIEPLNYDDHSKASLLRLAKTGRLTHHHNLYADIMARVTRFGNWNDNVVSRYNWYNNVVFNWGPESTYSYDNESTWNYVTRGGGSAGTDGEFVEINFMDNYFIAGPTTTLFKTYQGINAAHDKIWVSGVLTDFDFDPNHNGVDIGWNAVGGNYTAMPGAFSIESPYTFEDAATAYEKVLAQAGASYMRDAVDKRIVSEVKARTGIVPVTQDDVGGWPDIPEVHRPANFDTDGDGMPDAWEIAKGLNPDDADDGALDSGDGYTNLEKYLNFLASGGGKLPGDFTYDDVVDINDLATLASHWLEDDCDNVPAGDLDNDCDVDFYDFAVFAGNWNG